MRDALLTAIRTAGYEYPDISLNQAVSEHLAQKWSCELFHLPSWDTPVMMDHNLEMAGAYFFFGNAINFGFYPDHDTMGPVGNIDFWLTLRGHPELLEPVNLIHLTPQKMRDLFGPLPLLDERLRILQETARTLRLKFNGRVTELYEANHWNAPEIVQTIIKDFPSFRDNIREVPFTRKAQLILFMTHARFQDNMVFTNLDKLTVCADVQVFNGLLQLGVLELGQQTLRILSQGFISAQSELEFAVRCWTLLGAEDLLSRINCHRNNPITTYQLDYVLRQNGTNGKAPLPLALTTSY